MAARTLHPIDESRVERFAALLRRSFDVEQEYTASDFNWTGFDRSQAADELRSVSKDRAAEGALKTSFALARLGIVSAAEELSTIAQVLAQPNLAGIGTHVLARATVEACARSAWLLAKRDVAGWVDGRRRIARSLCDRLYSACEARRLADALDIERGSSRFAPPPETIKRLAESVGLSASFDMDRFGFAIRVDELRRPTTTALVKHLLAESIFRSFSAGAYAQLSAFTHATEYGLLQFYRESTTRAGAIDRTIDQRQIETAAGLSLIAWIATMKSAVALMGWGKTSIELLEQSVRRHLETGPLAAPL